MEVFQCEFAFVQLTIGEDLVNNLLGQSLDARRGRIG